MQINDFAYTDTHNISQAIINLEQSKMNGKGFYLSNLTTKFPLIEIASQSVVNIGRFYSQNISGPILFSKQSDITFFQSFISQIKHNSKIYSLFTVDKGGIDLSETIFKNIIK